MHLTIVNSSQQGYRISAERTVYIKIVNFLSAGDTGYCTPHKNRYPLSGRYRTYHKSPLSRQYRIYHKSPLSMRHRSFSSRSYAIHTKWLRHMCEKNTILFHPPFHHPLYWLQHVCEKNTVPFHHALPPCNTIGSGTCASNVALVLQHAITATQPINLHHALPP